MNFFVSGDVEFIYKREKDRREHRKDGRQGKKRF
jgi:hypothetical protein